ncbi:MAG: ABC transporter permease [Mangrovicoccus sp.]
MIAWRYLRATRAEGGISVMTWISLIGITLAVFALIATLAVRAGFRAELVDTILGANAHISVYGIGEIREDGSLDRTLADDSPLAQKLRDIPGVTGAAAVVRGFVIASAFGNSAGVQVTGITAGDLARLPRIADPETALGDLDRLPEGIALGSGVARQLGVTIGDRVKLISPDGAKTPFGTSPRIASYEVVYIFSAGRYDIDQVRVYMPFAEAQGYFNRQSRADLIEVTLERPEAMDRIMPGLFRAIGGEASFLTWQQANGNYLRALEVEDNVMFVILSVLVLIATMNITSGLIMLVKNKGRDIGILRTIGLTEGAVLRVFFLCGVSIGLAGTLAGVILGCLFALYIDPIFAAVNMLSGGGVWDPSIRGIYYLPAKLQLGDVITAVALSLGMSCVVTIFPARRAARMNPVEALRYE